MDEPTTSQKQHLNQRWLRILKPFGILLLVLLGLHLVIYFSSDFLLRNYLKNKVSQASEQKYEVDFDRFYISLFQRGLIFEGFKLTPVEEAFVNMPDVPYYKISVPKISLTRLFYAFGKREIQIGLISLNNPSIEFRLMEDEGLMLESEEPSPLQLLEEEIRKSFGDVGLKEVRIKALQIKEADLLLKNFISQKSIKIDHADVLVKDIQLLQDRYPLTPLNAAGFSIDLNNFEILLADSVHNIKASEVRVSSLEQFIKAKNVSISPDFTKKSATYFEVNLDDLHLGDADINKVFYTTEVDVGSLRLSKPVFHLFTSKSQEESTDEGEFELYGLIEGILKAIQVDSLEIEEGKFTQTLIGELDKPRIKSERIDFEMQNVYVGPDSALTQDQFFFAENASLLLQGVELSLGDQIHKFVGEYVSLSSFDDKILMRNVKIVPTTEADSVDNETIFEIDIPEIKIEKSNLKKIYNEGIVDISNVMIDSPEIILRDVQSNDETDKKSFDLQVLTRDFLRGIYIERLEVIEGSLVIDNNLRIRQDSLSFGKLNLVLEKFALDQYTDSNGKGIFFAENLQVELKDYALKLADNLHVFKANSLFVDTKSSIVRIEGFSIRPFQVDQLQSTLQNYDKTTAIDLYIPRFMATGVDLKRAYFRGDLDIREIRVPSPKINIYKYGTKDRVDEDKVDRQDILDLLRAYFTEVTVNRLTLERGSVNYENYGVEKLRTFSEDNVSVAVKNFHIDQNTTPAEVGNLFSEEVDLGLNNYVFSIADGKYNIVADRISFNTAREEIITSNVQLRPSTRSVDKTRISVNIPTLAFTGVDLEKFMFDNELNLNKVKFSGSSVNLLLNKDVDESENESRSRRRDRTLPKTINLINIDTVMAEKANFNLSIRENGQARELVNTGIDLSIFDFMLDSATLARGDVSAFFGGLSLSIDEFWLTLPDSVHRVTFSKVELDTRYEGILLNNLRIIPHNLYGKPGAPIISGHIPTALIKTKAVAEAQVKKDLVISEFRLFRPDIELFTDDEDNQSASEDSQEEVAVDNMSQVLERIFIEEFEIVDGNLSFYDKNASKEPQIFNRINVSLQDLDLDLEEMSGFDKSALLKKEFKVSLPDYEIYTKDSLNVIRIGYVMISQDKIQLQQVSFEPLYGKYQYTKIANQEIDVMNMQIPEILIKKPDLKLLADKQMLKAEVLSVMDLNGTIFRDKRFPSAVGKYKMMPQELMQQVGFDAMIDTLKLENGRISYEEFPEKGMVPGEINFSELDALVFPFHLSKEKQGFDLDQSFIKGNVKLNDVAPLTLSGIMYYQAPYQMFIQAEVGAFDFELINPILMPNAFVKVRQGQVHGGEWSFVADNKDARGEMVLKYNDLRVDLLDERTLEVGKGRKKILTFVLNTFALKSHNPRKFPRNTVKGQIYEPRNTEKFIFNYWWKTTFSGMKGTFGFGQSRPPKKLPLIKKKEEE
ncbi:hypothetical protein ACFOUP_06400 [Belliella kenyensis]|uniref:Translocation/assembly module TamB n=1 Tax=Belliella kenyensis TaxID=1472724 RepID=A0ABV8EJ08_9BACT|nr:hypothetical protein [Belliella kenyensis]MCH7401307.1 hypothetical protein [Belliella kenyensis]MDN3602752.1 hypothetical protein [Belliella kenyensis]